MFIAYPKLHHTICLEKITGVNLHKQYFIFAHSSVIVSNPATNNSHKRERAERYATQTDMSGRQLFAHSDSAATFLLMSSTLSLRNATTISSG